MDYKSLMGYGKKKNPTKKQSKPKKNQILEGIKTNLNEFDEKMYRQDLKEVSAAPQYKKMYKDIIKAENQLAKSVDKMASFLNKQGLKNQSMMLKGNYIQDVRDFVDKFLKGFIKELL
tara:strand:+ start:165 stop:518 length:354 start_codon:yes stop_codon:yes gene_type:complete